MVDVIVKNKYNDRLTGIKPGTLVEIENKKYVVGRIAKTGLLTPVGNSGDVFTFQIGGATLGESLSRFMSFKLNKTAKVVPTESGTVVLGKEIPKMEDNKVKENNKLESKKSLPNKSNNEHEDVDKGKDNASKSQDVVIVQSFINPDVEYLIIKGDISNVTLADKKTKTVLPYHTIKEYVDSFLHEAMFNKAKLSDTMSAVYNFSPDKLSENSIQNKIKQEEYKYYVENINYANYLLDKKLGSIEEQLDRMNSSLKRLAANENKHNDKDVSKPVKKEGFFFKLLHLFK